MEGTPPSKVDLKHYKASEKLANWPKKNTASKAKKAMDGKRLSEGDSPVQFEGALVYSEAWSYQDYGVYTFAAEETPAFREKFLTDYPQSGGGFFTDRYYYMTYYSEDSYTGEVSVYTSVYDRTTGDEVDGIYQNIAALATDMDYDVIDDRAYGCFYGDGITTVWGYMDPKTGNVTEIAPLATELVAVAIDGRGKAYGIDENGTLVTINKRTGQLTAIGATGYPPAGLQTAAFGADGNLYWAATSEIYYSSIFQVNLETGQLTTVATLYNNEELVSMTPLAATPSTGAPAKAKDLSIKTDGDSLDFDFSFSVPSKTYGATTLSGDVNYEVRIDGETAKTGIADAGSTVNATLSATAAGNHYITVTLSNSAGDSETASIRQWIGIDEPMPVTGVSLAKVSDTELTVSWQAPTSSVNGGFFDASRLSYTITRLPDYKVVSENQKALSFTDDLSDVIGQKLIRYMVTPYADTAEGRSVVSEGIIMGQPYQVPIEFTFDTEEDYNIFTVIDNNETLNLDSGCWLYSPSGQVAGYNCGSKNGDDWLITPGIKMYADRQYVFSHDVLCYSDYWPDEYEVFMGNAATIAGMDTRLLERTVIWWDDFRTNTMTVTVPEDGVYYFGFHALSEAGGAFFLVDNISVREALKLQTPSAVENLTVTAAPEGELEATISFTTPTTTVEGGSLSSISEIIVQRGGKTVYTFDNPTPGESLSYTDKEINRTGTMTYIVTPVNSVGSGAPSVAEAWVGCDVPKAPVNAAVMLDNDNHPVISWESATGPGMHGGYVDYECVTYSVYNGMTGEGLKQGLDETIYTDVKTTVDDSTNEQKLYSYIILPFYDGSHGGDASAIYISGKPYGLPFEESFADATPSYYWAFHHTNGEGWEIADDMSAYSQDGDNGLIYYVPAVPEVVTTAVSGKISMAGAQDPTLSFHMAKLELADNGFTDYDPNTDYLNIKVSYDDFEPVALDSIHLNSIKGNGYQKYTFDLPKAVGCEFITISFELEAYSGRIPVLLDNITVTAPNASAQPTEWPAPYDLKADANQGTDRLTLTWTAPATAPGNFNKPIGYNVFRDGNRMNETPLNQTTYIISPILKGTYTVSALYSNGESEPSNAVTVNVNMVGLEMPTVTDLDYVVDGDDIILKWNSPIFEEDGETTTVFDGFEEYRNGAITFGNWTTIDNSPYGNDGLRDFIVDFDFVNLPTANSGHAFMVWTPANYIDLAAHPEWAPHSGGNLIMSFCDMASYLTEAPNDDWLISPALEGKSCRLSFWARTGSKSNRNDYIKVMYSTTGNDLSDFTVVPSGDINLDTEWTKYEFNLPSGTKYFAINNYSMKGYVVLIDDLEYTTGDMHDYDNLVGYNVYYEGKTLNKQLVPAESDYIEYTVVNGKEGEYYVTAIYEQGESEPSNVVNVSLAPLPTPAVTDLGYVLENGALTLTWSEPEGVSTNETSFLVGYYIYRDGICLNPELGIVYYDEPLKYTVKPAVSGRYTVRVLYLDGESDDSNVVIVDVSSVESLFGDSEELKFHDLNGHRVKCPEKGKIYIVNGEKILLQ